MLTETATPAERDEIRARHHEVFTTVESLHGAQITTKACSCGVWPTKNCEVFVTLIQADLLDEELKATNEAWAGDQLTLAEHTNALAAALRELAQARRCLGTILTKFVVPEQDPTKLISPDNTFTIYETDLPNGSVDFEYLRTFTSDTVDEPS